jgi:hypothetical protein
MLTPSRTPIGAWRRAMIWKTITTLLLLGCVNSFLALAIVNFFLFCVVRLENIILVVDIFLATEKLENVCYFLLELGIISFEF